MWLFAAALPRPGYTLSAAGAIDANERTGAVARSVPIPLCAGLRGGTLAALASLGTTARRPGRSAGADRLIAHVHRRVLPSSRAAGPGVCPRVGFGVRTGVVPRAAGREVTIVERTSRRRTTQDGDQPKNAACIHLGVSGEGKTRITIIVMTGPLLSCRTKK